MSNKAISTWPINFFMGVITRISSFTPKKKTIMNEAKMYWALAVTVLRSATTNNDSINPAKIASPPKEGIGSTCIFLYPG